MDIFTLPSTWHSNIHSTIFLSDTFYYWFNENYKQKFFFIRVIWIGTIQWNLSHHPLTRVQHFIWTMSAIIIPVWKNFKKISFLIITQDHDWFALVVRSVKRKVLVSIQQFVSRNIRNTRFPDTGCHNGYP